MRTGLAPARRSGGEQTVPLGKFFELMARWWKADPYVNLASDPSVLQAHPGFRAIVQEGPRIAPMILRDYQSAPEAPWDLALELIFPNVTFPEEHRGKPKPIREDWLTWGRTNGFLA